MERRRLQSSHGWKLTNVSPWVLALFREAFTRTRQRIPLDEFQSLTGSFLHQLELNGQDLCEDWTGNNYADGGAAVWPRVQPQPRCRHRMATPFTFPRTLP